MVTRDTSEMAIKAMASSDRVILSSSDIQYNYDNEDKYAMIDIYTKPLSSVRV